MEDEFLKGVGAGYKKGKELGNRKDINSYTERSMGAATKAKRDGNKKEAYYYNGYIAGLNNINAYLTAVKAIGE